MLTEEQKKEIEDLYNYYWALYLEKKEELTLAYTGSAKSPTGGFVNTQSQNFEPTASAVTSDSKASWQEQNQRYLEFLWF